jgi:hypothetical protein
MWPANPANVTEMPPSVSRSEGFILADSLKSKTRDRWLKLSDIQDRLPEPARWWVAGMSSAERHGTEIVLNNVGLKSFLKYWKEYRDELAEIRNF